MTYFTRNHRRKGVPKVARCALWAAAIAVTPVSGWTQATQPAAPQPNAAGSAAQPAGRPGVEVIASRRVAGASSAARSSDRRKTYSFVIPSTGWVDTGVDVLAGEEAAVTATGEVTLGNGNKVGPDGLQRGWKDLLRQYPLNSANAGELIARVTDLGASVPFVLGATGKATMPTTGRLFLAVNVPPTLAGTGQFAVTWRFESPAASAKGPAAGAGPALGSPLSAVSPALFAAIPRRVADPNGTAGDMVNFALLGTEEQVLAAFKAAGWAAVDKDVGAAVLHGLLATLSREAYVEMPMSTLYLFGRAQDLSFARADPLQVAAERHHLRLWKTAETLGGKPLWVGSATHDVGFERDRRKESGITHKIDPDIDLERSFLLDSFDATGRFVAAAYVTPANPLREAKTATGGSFHSDGRILVMDLKPVDLK